jgi:hypothetical protein
VRYIVQQHDNEYAAVTGNPPYSDLPYLPDGTGIRPVRVGSKLGGA